jgi:prepilin-type N-terminal cleavage/methylation domain-containing protein
MSWNKKIKNQKGFTLIEIIAVIIIMGILAAVAVPKFFSMQEDAKRAALNGGLSEAASRFNHAYARYILDLKVAPPNVAALHTAAYLGTNSGTAGTGESIGDFMITWLPAAAPADPATAIDIFVEAAESIPSWDGITIAHRTLTVEAITWGP